MQEEVQATDVLRVGRWYDDLLAGGERGKAIVKCLATGPSGADEEGGFLDSYISLLNSGTDISMEIPECTICSSSS